MRVHTQRRGLMSFLVGRFVFLAGYVVSVVLSSIGPPLLIFSFSSGLRVSIVATTIVVCSILFCIVAAKKMPESLPFSVLLPISTCCLFFLENVILTGPLILAGSVFVAYLISGRIRKSRLPCANQPPDATKV